MPRRRTIFIEGEIYHIFNRGVASVPIFKKGSDYQRFISLIDYYRFADTLLSFSEYEKLNHEEKEEFKKRRKEMDVLIEIYAYCLLENHFHLLLQQKSSRGIQKVLANVQNAYGKYFNIKNSRGGPLFQSRFKAKRIETDEVFLHLSRYIHLNPSTSYIIEAKNLKNYEWSSYPEYIGEKLPIFIKPEKILTLIGDKSRYKTFVLNQSDYQKKLNEIKHLVIEA